jgi:tetratricopeptide (TPR) repeat protein
LGLVFEQSGRQSEAIAAYESAVRINPRESLAQANLGNIAFAQADYATAIARYQNAVLADPTLVNTQLLLAQSFILANQLDSALVHARTALEFSPQNDTARRMVQDLRGIVP